MLSCRPVIAEHISWNLGDGTSASFWEDSWNSYDVLNKWDVLEEIKRATKEKWYQK